MGLLDVHHLWNDSGSFGSMDGHWAAEDSALRGIWNCILCRPCRKKDDNDERGEPLIP